MLVIELKIQTKSLDNRVKKLFFVSYVVDIWLAYKEFITNTKHLISKLIQHEFYYTVLEGMIGIN